jgi:geranylgeranyl reductase family protein
MENVYDVIIVGSGPGGSATAHYLSAHGLKVLLLDKADFPRDKTCGDGLTPRAVGVLDDMGILPEAKQLGWRINGLELHAARGEVMVSPIPKNGASPDYLLIVPRFRLDDLIRQRAVASGAEFRSPVRVRGVEQNEDHVLVRGDSKGQSVAFKGHLAVLAVGANLRLLLDMGILKTMPRTILAARAYYEGMAGLADRVQAHFDKVPLPGYGWVFPLSETSANVGVGYWPSRMPWARFSGSARSAMSGFLQNPKVNAMMADAAPVGPVRGYPLRIDFASAPTYDHRVLLVGESAGLVSPLTGEGIDFALESGKLAARFLRGTFESGDFSLPSLAVYDQVLRDHFQRLFVFLEYLRRLYINPFLMSRAVRATETNPDLKSDLVNILMGHQDAADMVTLKTFFQVVFA